MFLEIGFAVYVLSLILSVVYLGLNYYRIEAKWHVHPQVIAFLLPFLINYLCAQFVFYPINPFFTTLMPCIFMYFLGRKLKSIRIFGLTGGIACGKSTLVRQIEQNLLLTVTIIDCDKLTRQLSNKGKSGYSLIVSMLGEKKEQYLNPLTREIQREKFSNFVFQNELFRKELTRRMGRLIFWDIFKQIIGNVLSKKNLILIDAPVLYQTKVLEHICFPIIVVGCSIDLQVSRLMSRGISRQEADKRIASQMPISIKKKKADIYVQNNGSPQQMFTSVLKRLNKYLSVKKK